VSLTRPGKAPHPKLFDSEGYGAATLLTDETWNPEDSLTENIDLYSPFDPTLGAVRPLAEIYKTKPAPEPPRKVEYLFQRPTVMAAIPANKRDEHEGNVIVQDTENGDDNEQIGSSTGKDVKAQPRPETKNLAVHSVVPAQGEAAFGAEKDNASSNSRHKHLLAANDTTDARSQSSSERIEQQRETPSISLPDPVSEEDPSTRQVSQPAGLESERLTASTTETLDLWQAENSELNEVYLPSDGSAAISESGAAEKKRKIEILAFNLAHPPGFQQNIWTRGGNLLLNLDLFSSQNHSKSSWKTSAASNAYEIPSPSRPNTESHGNIESATGLSFEAQSPVDDAPVGHVSVSYVSAEVVPSTDPRQAPSSNSLSAGNTEGDAFVGRIPSVQAPAGDTRTGYGTESVIPADDGQLTEAPKSDFSTEVAPLGHGPVIDDPSGHSLESQS
jgi:hypothetical protein